MEEPVSPVEPVLPFDELPEPFGEDFAADDARFVPLDLAVDDFERVEADFVPEVRFFVPVVLPLEALLLVALLLPDVLELARFVVVFLGELLVPDVLPEAARDADDLDVEDLEALALVLLLARVLLPARDFDGVVEVFAVVLPLDVDDLADALEVLPVFVLVELARFLAVEPLVLEVLPVVDPLEAGVVLLPDTASAASWAAERTLEAT